LIAGIKLKTGHTKSCGCLRSEICRINGIKNKTHEKRKTSLWAIWHGMKERCLNPNYHNYSSYGGRGISICEDWLKFENFDKWNDSLGEEGYKRGLSIDRIDNDKGYSPSNCRWTTFVQQGRNKRNNVLVTINGKIKPVSEWAEYYVVSRYLVYNRIKIGWQLNEKLFVPTDSRRSKRAGIHGGSI
jgi:hypothetical protein